MKRLIILGLIIASCLSLMTPALSPAEEKSWDGVDVAVVEKFADAAGRPAQEPYINTDQGDLLLFVFAIAGVIGGFIMGYCWRELFGSQASSAPCPDKK
jgi:cobalt/nickel transport protein